MFNLDKLPVQDLVDLLFKLDLAENLENNLLKEVKKRITTNIFNYTTKSEEIKQIKKIASTKRHLILNYLNSDISLERKKIILKITLNEEEMINLLNNNLVSKELKDYIQTQDYQIYTYYSLLANNNLSDEVFNFILTKIKYNNVLKILSYEKIDNQKKEIIIKEKKKDIKKAINIATPRKLLNIYLSYKLPEDILNYILKTKKNNLNLASLLLNKYNIKNYYLMPRTKQSVDFLYQTRKETVINILENLRVEEIFEVLNNQMISNELKEIIITKNKYNYQKAITNKIFKDPYYLITECRFLPHKVIDDIFILKKDMILSIILCRIKKVGCEYFLLDYEKNPYLIEKIYNMICQSYSVDLKELFNMTTISGLEFLKFLINKNSDYIEDIITKIVNGKSIMLKEEVLLNIIDIKKELITSRINKMTKEEIFNLLKNTPYSKIQKMILNKFELIEDQEFILSLINSNITEEILFNSNLIKEFILKSKMNIDDFLQYGVGTKKYNNWSIIMINIIKDNKLEEFIRVKDYFMKNYYQNDNLYLQINNFLDILINYYTYQDLCSYLEINNINLDDNLKSCIQFLFASNQVKNIPKNIDELINFKRDIYQEYALRIKDENISIIELMDIIKHLFFNIFHGSLINIGGEFSLSSIPSITNEISDLKEELMIYARLNNILNFVSDKDVLKKIISLIIEIKDNDLIYLMNQLKKIDIKIKRLYELDSKVNLTTLDKARQINDIQNQNFIILYGGETFDFSDKDYVLYAHVVSNGEKIEDLVNGLATGENNFISLSAISYMGQKYYYNSNTLTLAYDTIPDNSFICSSVQNMGSNYLISKNSFEVEDVSRLQKGIVDTSASIFNNSEALFYREGLKPCGIILKGGRKPSAEEIEYHHKYKLPFIITQDEYKIENPKIIFHQEIDIKPNQNKLKRINDSFDLITRTIYQERNDIYTGRRIGLFADSHALYEPTKAIIEDMENNGVTEIYSLGDNIGVGPNPEEVLELLEKYKVQSVMGNQEYYITLGTEPFSYLTEDRIKSSEWTKKQIASGINNLYFYKPSIELIVGNKKISLCHFANDVRFDYYKNSTWTYQANYQNNDAAKQFLYTNSREYFNQISNNDSKNSRIKAGYHDAKHNLLFQGKQITYYDSIFQGHVHFEMKDKINDTNIYTLRGAGIGFTPREINTAYYLILKEKKNGGFDIERKLITYNRDNLIEKVNNSNMPGKETLKKYLNIR